MPETSMRLVQPHPAQNAAHLQQGLPPAITIVSTLDGGGKDTESSTAASGRAGPDASTQEIVCPR